MNAMCIAAIVLLGQFFSHVTFAQDDVLAAAAATPLEQGSIPQDADNSSVKSQSKQTDDREAPLGETTIPDRTAGREPGRQAAVKRAARVDKIVLVGDAKAQVGATAGAASGASFGGGILYRSDRTLAVIMLNTSPDRNVLAEREKMGAFVLTPTASNVSGEVAVERFFAVKQLLSDTPHLGLRFRAGVGGAKWALPDGGQSASLNVIGIDAQLGLRRVFVADDDNYVEAFGFIGPVVRILGGDASKPFRRQASGTGQAIFPGGLFYGGLRIGRLEVAGHVSWIPPAGGPRLPGVHSIQFIIGLELRDGPALATTE